MKDSDHTDPMHDVLDAIHGSALLGKLEILPNGAGIEYAEQSGCAPVFFGLIGLGVSVFLAVRGWGRGWGLLWVGISFVMIGLIAIGLGTRRTIRVAPGRIQVKTTFLGFVRDKAYDVAPEGIEVYEKSGGAGGTALFGIRIRGKILGLPFAGTKTEARTLLGLFERALRGDLRTPLRVRKNEPDR